MVPLKPFFSKSAHMNADAPIALRNRHTGGTEVERVFGEAWLKRIYGNPLGKLSLHAVVKRAFFSDIYGFLADRPSSAKRVIPFIRDFGLDPSEFAEADPAAYRTFNEFFYRKLKATARPIDPRPELAVLPADGRHLGFPDAGAVKGIFAKGQTFDIPALVADRALGERYARGTVVCSRLCPVDYHRFHFPVAGTPGPRRPRCGATLPGAVPPARRDRARFGSFRRTSRRGEFHRFLSGRGLCCPWGLSSQV